MSKVQIPRQFFFRFELQCRRIAKLPRAGAHPLDLPPNCRLAFPGLMDDETPFADVRAAWNESGLGIQYQTRGKRESPYGEPDQPTACDGMSLWIDSRDVRNVQRAGRFCQRFFILANTDANGLEPSVIRRPIGRALEEPPTVDLSAIRVALFGVDDDGDPFPVTGRRNVSDYRLEAFFPASTIHGFDCDVNTRLGICYHIRDRELGNQILGSTLDFPFWENPSLWCVLNLRKD